MKTEEEKRKHADYMREYYAKNKEKIRAQRSQLRKKKIKSGDLSERVAHNKRNKEYFDRNKERLLSERKERGWNRYSPTRAKYGKQFMKRHPGKVMIGAIKTRAKKNNLPFDLTIDWYDEQFAKGCAVTNLPLDIVGSKTAFTAHIDRKHPELGYVQSNCQMVCASYNLAKKNWSRSDVIIMAKALLENVHDS